MGEIDGSLGHRLGPEMLKGIMIHLLLSFFWIPVILAGKSLTTCTGSQGASACETDWTGQAYSEPRSATHIPTQGVYPHRGALCP